MRFKKLIIFLLLSLVLLVACSPTTNFTNKINDCDNDTCIINLINNELTTDIDCNVFYEEDYQNLCISQKAKLTNNKEICNEMKGLSTNFKNLCQQQFDHPELIVDKYVFTCLQQEHHARISDCYADMVLETKDITYCNFLYDAKEINNCISATKNKAIEKANKKVYFNKTKREETNYKDYFNGTKASISLCEEIAYNTSLISNNAEFHKCLTQYGIKYEDYEQCLKLKSDEHRNFCLRIFAIEFEEPKFCSFINKSSDYSLDCFRFLAKNLKDVNICFNLDNNKDYKDSCIESYNLYYPDISYCELIENAKLNFQCVEINYYQDRTLTTDICELVYDNNYQITCLAIINNDISYCEKIDNYLVKRNCRFKVEDAND